MHNLIENWNTKLLTMSMQCTAKNSSMLVYSFDLWLAWDAMSSKWPFSRFISFFSLHSQFVFGCNLTVTSAWADGHQTCNHKLCIAFFTGQFKWFFENIIMLRFSASLFTFCFISVPLLFLQLLGSCFTPLNWMYTSKSVLKTANHFTTMNNTHCSNRFEHQ